MLFLNKQIYKSEWTNGLIFKSAVWETPEVIHAIIGQNVL